MLDRALPHHYYAYLLRCWQEPGSEASGSATCRFSLEDPHRGLRRGFASFEALIAFLAGQLTDGAFSALGSSGDQPAATT